MKRTYFLMLTLLIASAASLKSQVTIGSLEPPKATLDVVAVNTDGTTAEGIIAPRLTLSQLILANAQYTPEQRGAIVYVTDLTGAAPAGKTAAVAAIGYYFFDGAVWQPFVPDNGWLTTGNAGTDSLIHFIGTTDLQPLMFRVNNSPAGTIGINGVTALGLAALRNNTTGNNNAAFGDSVLYLNAEGSYNSAFGYQALHFNTADNNSAFGNRALYRNTTGTNNSAFGDSTLVSNITGSSNSAFGNRALKNNTAGNNNSAFGTQALMENTGRYNSAFGAYALAKNTTGIQNSAFGNSAFQFNTIGNQNSAFGSAALYSNTEGNNNNSFGNNSLRNNTTGSYNVAFGDSALYDNTTASNNAAFGAYALRSLADGTKNTALGDSTLFSYFSGNYNTAIGAGAGSQGYAGTMSGDYNILIGANAMPSGLDVSGEITIGSLSTTKARVFAPEWQFVSDRRLKHDINPIAQGLDFVLKLKPVEFVYNNRSDNTKSLGFIAQDVQKVMNAANMSGYDMVSNMDENTLGLSTGELIPVLTKAIQEQQKLIEQLEARIAALEAK